MGAAKTCDRLSAKTKRDYAGEYMGPTFLLVTDSNSKWLEVLPPRSSTSAATITLLQGAFPNFGLPEHIVELAIGSVEETAYKSCWQPHGTHVSDCHRLLLKVTRSFANKVFHKCCNSDTSPKSICELWSPRTHHIRKRTTIFKQRI